MNSSSANHFSQRGFMVALVVIIGALVMSQRASADGIIYGDIAGGNDIASGYSVGPGGGVNNAIAEGFTMTQSYNLTSVDIMLSSFSPGTGSNLALSIYSNNGSNNPGTDLYDLSTNVTLPISGSPLDVNLTGTGSFLLTAGTTYWLNFYATNSASQTGNNVQWDGAFTPSASGFATPMGVGATELGQLRSVQSGNPPTGTPTTSELRTAFQLNGSVVPEPSSMVLACLAAAGLAVTALRRCKR
jgi:hypothetical protein